RVDARVRVEPNGILLRRLALNGSIDFDPDPGTMPACDLAPTDWRAFEVRVGALRVRFPDDRHRLAASGRVHATIPAALAHRFAKTPHLTGSVGVDVEGDFDAESAIPRLTGSIVAIMPGLDGKVFAHELHANIATSSAGIEVTKLEASWGDGKVTIGRVT